MLAYGSAYALQGHFELLSDPTRKLTLTDVLNQSSAGAFKAYPKHVNRGFSDEALWLRCQIQRQPPFPAQAYLVINPPILDSVIVFVQSGEAAEAPDDFTRFNLGDHVPVRESGHYQPEFTVPINLPESSIRWIYLRIETTSILNVNARILTPAEFARQSNLMLVVQVALLASFLMVGLTSLIFSVRLRESLYGCFGGFLLALVVNRLAATGLLPIILPDSAHLIADALFKFNGLAAWFLAWFGLRLYRHCLTVVERAYIYGILAVLSLNLLLCWRLPLSYSMPANYIAGLLLTGFLWWKTCTTRQRGLGGEVFNCLGFGCLLLGVLSELLRLQGLIPQNLITTNTIQLFSFLNCWFLTLGLAERIRQEQSRALVAEKNAKHLAEEMAHDMTIELREKQQALEKTVQRQAQFVALVSHEYRTPLAVIRTNLHLLSKMQDDPAGNVSFALGKINRAISSLVEVMEISLGKARLAEEIIHLNLHRFPALAFLRELAEQTKEFWPDRDVTWAINLTPKLDIMADRKLLQTALLNLLDNALKYSVKPARIRVNADQRENGLRISVADAGSGIPTDKLKRVFEKYYRMAGNTVPGSGIGLYLVDKIVEQHQGHIDLHSSPSGTTVTLLLPIVCLETAEMGYMNGIADVTQQK